MSLDTSASSSQSARILANGLLALHCDAYDTLMTAWPSPRAWERSKGDRKWHSIRPVISIPAGDIKEIYHYNCRVSERDAPPMDRDGLQMLLPFDYCPWSESDRETRLAWLRFYLSIPEDVRGTIVRSYPNQQWEMLSFVAQYGTYALELIVSNPALCFALVTMNEEFRLTAGSFRLDSLAKVFKPGISQIDMLDMVGFPPTNAVRNILRKLTAEALSFRNLLSLRQSLLSSGIVKILGHLSGVNSHVINTLADPEICALASPKLLQEIADETESDDLYPPTVSIIKDMLDVSKWHPCTGRTLPVFRSREHVWNTWLKLEAERHEALTRKTIEECRNRPFPPPPYPGNRYICPIDSFPALEREALEQDNCAVEYSERIIMFEDTYLYSVKWPERCTLSLVKEGGRWSIGELYQADNQSAGTHTHWIVRRWLSNRQDLER